MRPILWHILVVTSMASEVFQTETGEVWKSYKELPSEKTLLDEIRAHTLPKQRTKGGIQQIEHFFFSLKNKK